MRTLIVALLVVSLVVFTSMETEAQKPLFEGHRVGHHQGKEHHSNINTNNNNFGRKVLNDQAKDVEDVDSGISHRLIVTSP